MKTTLSPSKIFPYKTIINEDGSFEFISEKSEEKGCNQGCDSVTIKDRKEVENDN